jgi:hypothetical protein
MVVAKEPVPVPVTFPVNVIVGAVVKNVDCGIVVPFPRTRLVPDSADTTPEVLINVPVVNPDKVKAGVVTVPVNVGDAITAYVVEAVPVVRYVAVSQDIVPLLVIWRCDVDAGLARPVRLVRLVSAA